MKKIITLLVSVTMIASVFAQPGNRDQRDYGYGNKDQRDYGYDKEKDVVFNDGRYKKDDSYYNDSYFFRVRERDRQIAEIKHEYEHKIQDVKNRFFMPRFKKERIIWRLEEQCKDEIRMVYMKFNRNKNRNDDHDHGPRRNW